MDQQQIEAERYKMIVAHADRCAGPLVVTIVPDNRLMLEPHCTDCGWWDHWDS